MSIVQLDLTEISPSLGIVSAQTSKNMHFNYQGINFQPEIHILIPIPTHQTLISKYSHIRSLHLLEKSLPEKIPASFIFAFAYSNGGYLSSSKEESLFLSTNSGLRELSDFIITNQTRFSRNLNSQLGFADMVNKSQARLNYLLNSTK